MGIFNLLAALLGEDEQTFTDRIDALDFTSDTAMPPPPTNDQWQQLTGQTWDAMQAQISPWVGDDGRLLD